jgi:hypothetical protein
MDLSEAINVETNENEEKYPKLFRKNIFGLVTPLKKPKMIAERSLKEKSVI